MVNADIFYEVLNCSTCLAGQVECVELDYKSIISYDGEAKHIPKCVTLLYMFSVFTA